MGVDGYMTDSERAAKGAAFMDGQRPDWFERVDPARLNIANACTCVMGQVYGSYQAGLAETHLHGGIAEHGFTNSTPELNEAWREEIARRRLARVPVPA